MIVMGSLFPAGFQARAEDAETTRIEYPSSMNPVGSGARALSMGGAFISIADDATAASWNPAGLVQLEWPELSWVFESGHREENTHFGKKSHLNASNTTNLSNLNYLSMVFPINEFKIDPQYQTHKLPQMVVSFNYQHLYDFNREWDSLDYKQTGDLYAFGIAFATQVYKYLRLGVTINYWGDVFHENKWEQTYDQHMVSIFPPPPIPGGQTIIDNTFQHDTYTIEDGWNANIGFLYDFGKFRLGGVYKFGFKAEIDHRIYTKYSTEYPDEPDKSSDPDPTVTHSKDHLYMPMSFGLGLTYFFSQDFKIAGDFYTTKWNDFEYQHDDGRVTSPLSGKDIHLSDIGSTTWFRIGGEYRMTDHNRPKTNFFAIRGGMFYDPSPADGSPDDIYGLTTGFGYGREIKQYHVEKIIIDTAYQYRWGNNVGESMLPNYQFDQDIREHKVYVSMIVHFL
jgi:long-subunit fatty acid transport protein